MTINLRKSLLGAAALSMLMGAGALSGAMRAFDNEMPALGSRRTPTFTRVVEYDGNGNKVRPKQHPKHNAKRRDWSWRRYADRVMSTHRVLPDGTFQEDPRDAKYLHSSALWGRGLRKALAR